MGVGVGGGRAVPQGEFVIPSSLKNDRSLLFSIFHSSSAMTLFRAHLGQDMLEFIYFFLWYFLLLLLTWFILFTQHQGNMVRSPVCL